MVAKWAPAATWYPWVLIPDHRSLNQVWVPTWGPARLPGPSRREAPGRELALAETLGWEPRAAATVAARAGREPEASFPGALAVAEEEFPPPGGNASRPRADNPPWPASGCGPGDGWRGIAAGAA